MRHVKTRYLEENPLGDTLDRYGKAYPQWATPGQIKELTDLWQKYAGVFGVRFVTGDGGKDDFEQIACRQWQPSTGVKGQGHADQH